MQYFAHLAGRLDWSFWLGLVTLGVLLGMLRVVHGGKRGRVTAALTIGAVVLTVGTCYLLVRPAERRTSYPVVVDPADVHSPEGRRPEVDRRVRSI